jgi:hypothetical protein
MAAVSVSAFSQNGNRAVVSAKKMCMACGYVFGSEV